METKIFTLEGTQADNEKIAAASRIIQSGGIVAFPTETVYGLGGNAFNRESIEKIYTAKQRPFWDPVISHVSSVDELKRLVIHKPQFFTELVQAFMPGPLTILVWAKDCSADFQTVSNNKISLRVPDSAIARTFIQACGVPIAAPSANLFGRPSPTTAQHVLDDLNGKIDAVLDGGACSIGVESTVIDLTAHPPMIMRPGGITKEKIEQLIGPIQVFERFTEGTNELSSPGMTEQHYSPKAKVLLVQNEIEMHNAVLENSHSGIMLPLGWVRPESGEVFEWGDFDNVDILAHRLFLGFRELDRKGVKVIICPIPSKNGLGMAIRDRLMRAAAP